MTQSMPSLTPLPRDNYSITRPSEPAIVDILVIFTGAGTEAGTDERGRCYINSLYAATSEIKIAVTAYHPITGNVFSATLSSSDVHIGKNNIKLSSECCSVSLSFLLLSEELSFSGLELSPHCVIFCPESKTENTTTIEIKTKYPLMTTLDSENLTIELFESGNNYVYVEEDSSGFTSINGITSNNGEIKILGTGLTFVEVSPGLSQPQTPGNPVNPGTPPNDDDLQI